MLSAQMPEAEWNDERTRIICELFVEQVHAGNRPNTHLNNIGYRIAAAKFQERTQLLYTKLQLKNKWDKFKSDYITWKKLLVVGAGLPWDSGTRQGEHSLLMMNGGRRQIRFAILTLFLQFSPS